MMNEKLCAIFKKRHALGYLNFPLERKTWGEIIAELGLERGSWLEAPAGYVDIDDPGDPSPSPGRIRMTEEFAMRILVLGLP